MVRLVAALLLVTALIGTACSPEAATGQAELGSSGGQATPAPTADIADISSQPNLVVAPTPIPEGPRPLVIASVLGETGVMAPLDGAALAGVIAEIERINRAGGVLGRPIEIRRFDTNSRISRTERIVERFETSPPDLIIASCDVEFSQPVLDFAEEYRLLTISPCADDAGYLTGGLGSLNFTLGAPPEARGALMAAAALERYGSTATVLRDITSPEAIAFCDGFERAYRELGGSVIYRDEFRYDTLEPVEDRLAERGGQSDFITLCSHVPGELDGAPTIISSLRALGFTAPIVAGGTLDRPGWISATPALGELLFVSWSSTFGNDPDDRVNDLVRAVQQSGDLPAGGATILGAETVEAWARAVESARDSSPERVGSALASFNNENFSTGAISFVAGARMDVGRSYRIMLVAAGELTVVAVEETDN